MDKLLEKAEELKTSLLETKEYQEFLRMKALYDNNEEVKSLLTQMKAYKDNPKSLEKIKKEYYAHPVVSNYLEARKEVESILRVVKDIIEKWFW